MVFHAASPDIVNHGKGPSMAKWERDDAGELAGSHEFVQLIHQARAGDRESLDAVVTRVYPVMSRFLLYLSRDPELARDLTQDTMLAAARGIEQLERAEALMPWLYRIARNTYAAHYRRHARHRWLSLDAMLSSIGWERFLVDPGSAADHWDEAELVTQALVGLSPAAREVLYLRHVVGYSGSEIASILEISHAAAKQRLSRAERAFRRAYAELDTGAAQLPQEAHAR